VNPPSKEVCKCARDVNNNGVMEMLRDTSVQLRAQRAQPKKATEAIYGPYPKYIGEELMKKSEKASAAIYGPYPKYIGEELMKKSEKDSAAIYGPYPKYIGEELMKKSEKAFAAIYGPYPKYIGAKLMKKAEKGPEAIYGPYPKYIGKEVMNKAAMDMQSPNMQRIPALVNEESWIQWKILMTAMPKRDNNDLAVYLYCALNASA